MAAAVVPLIDHDHVAIVVALTFKDPALNIQ
jgi:hypothetical protein